MTPIIIPLGTDPTGTYIELRYTLRAIQKHYKDDRLFVLFVGNPPMWLGWPPQQGAFIYCPEKYPHKDADMIHKILTGIRYLEDQGYNGYFTKFSDDAILLGNYYPKKEKPKYFCPMASTLTRIGDGLWKQRFQRTMEYLQSVGIEEPLNFDTHTPQPYNTAGFQQFLENVPWQEDIGFCINSLYFNLALKDSPLLRGDVTPQGGTVGLGVEQITIDLTCPSRLAMIKGPLSSVREAEQATYRCRFLETDQAAFITPPFEKWLKIRFPKKSIFEG